MVDQNLINKTETTTLGGDDIFYVVRDPEGSPVDRKITKTNLLTQIVIPSTQVTGLGTAATQASTSFATAAQGALADSALQAGYSGQVTASSTTTFTNKSGNISQWTNNAGYLTATAEGFIVESELDFGSTAVLQKIFTITNASVTSACRISCGLRYDAPTSSYLDELEFAEFQFSCGQATTGEFKLLATSLNGFVSGKYKVFFHIQEV